VSAIDPQPEHPTWPICSRCRENEAAPYQRWCRHCATAYMRDYRKRGVPKAFQRFVRERAKERLGIELPGDFFDVKRERAG
jgi:hypothetical protein